MSLSAFDMLDQRVRHCCLADYAGPPQRVAGVTVDTDDGSMHLIHL